MKSLQFCLFVTALAAIFISDHSESRATVSGWITMTDPTIYNSMTQAIPNEKRFEILVEILRKIRLHQMMMKNQRKRQLGLN